MLHAPVNAIADYASAKTTAAGSTALLSVSMACRAFGVPVQWYVPCNLAVATISRHSLLGTALMYTNESEFSSNYSLPGSQSQYSVCIMNSCQVSSLLSYLLPTCGHQPMSTQQHSNDSACAASRAAVSGSWQQITCLVHQD